jgi:predicted ATPase
MAIHDLRTELAEAVHDVDPDGDSPALAMTAATSAYLAGSHGESSVDDRELLRLAARAEFRGKPPEHVAGWLAERGVET